MVHAVNAGPTNLQTVSYAQELSYGNRETRSFVGKSTRRQISILPTSMLLVQYLKPSLLLVLNNIVTSHYYLKTKIVPLFLILLYTLHFCLFLLFLQNQVLGLMANQLIIHMDYAENFHHLSQLQSQAEYFNMLQSSLFILMAYFINPNTGLLEVATFGFLQLILTNHL